ncbi:hypothetical protein N9N07_00810 [Pseudomonadales bacterium]|nr:hypothetical protein [Pseudomonadales bacterium]
MLRRKYSFMHELLRYQAAQRASELHVLERKVLSRLYRLDGLYDRAQELMQGLGADHAARCELNEYDQQRNYLKQQIIGVEAMDLQEWREQMIPNGGPLAIWDILAEALEDFIERYE